MARPINRQTFAEHCLRRLGAPVLEINVDDDQVDDRVDEALQKYWDFHHDGVEKLYLQHQITANNIANTYIDVPDAVIHVTKVFPLFNSGMSGNYMFDLRYQMRMSDLQSFTDVTVIDYQLVGDYIQTLNLVFNGVPGVRFNRNTNRLYIDVNWPAKLPEGSYVIIVCERLLNPDEYTDVWSDAWLLDYATALIKRQWGTNMKKFSGVQLPGGITMNGQIIYDEAVNEIEKLEAFLRDTFEEPPGMITG